MSRKLLLDSKTILEKQFSGSTPGYNALEVDEYLDRVIRDYETIEANALLDKSEYDSLLKELKMLREENKKLSLENEKYSLRLQNVRPDENVTSDNIELIKKINKYEKFLHDKGFDINKI